MRFFLFHIPERRLYSALVSKMNWTGGSLQRTKHVNKGVVQKQKAYFAKARTHLQNGSKSPGAPFRPTYLQRDSIFELAGHLPAFGSDSVRHLGHSARRRHDTTQRSPSPDDRTFADRKGLISSLQDTRQEPSHGDALATRLRRSELRGMLTIAVADLSKDVVSILTLLQMNNVESVKQTRQIWRHSSSKPTESDCCDNVTGSVSHLPDRSASTSRPAKRRAQSAVAGK